VSVKSTESNIDMDIKELIPFLKAQGVKCFKKGDLEVSFHGEQSVSEGVQADNQAPESPFEVLRKQESSLPPDLRTDNVNNFDTILNWSGSPQDEAAGIPGIDDTPIPVEA